MAIEKEGAVTRSEFESGKKQKNTTKETVRNVIIELYEYKSD